MIDIIIVLGLLLLGYGFGSYREKRHYDSIREREDLLKDILVFESRFPPTPTRISTTDPSQEESTASGGEMVLGNVVVSVDYFKMFVAGLRKLVGGRLRSYETLLDRGRREAVLRMKQQARDLGANRVFNVRFETASISKGQSNNLGSIEVLVYGSALKE